MILPRDFQIEVGATERDEFVIVRHLPTGKTRTTCPIGSRTQVELKLRMLDEIVEELVRKDVKPA